MRLAVTNKHIIDGGYTTLRLTTKDDMFDRRKIGDLAF
jgi:hypothetical protein